MTANAGSFILPGGSGAFGTFSVDALTLSASSAVSYDFGGGLQDLIGVNASGGLTLNGGGVNLFQADGATRFNKPGTYMLMNYGGALTGSAANLSVLNPSPGQTYAFSAVGGAVLLNIGTASSWTGGGNPNFNWSNAANWAGGAVPSSSQSITFTGITGLNNINNLANLNVGGITFDASAGAFVLSGNSIQLSGAIFNLSTATQTLAMNIGLVGGNQQMNALSGNIAINGVISDGDGGAPSGSGIVKYGAAALVLAASNGYSGGTVLNQGTIEVGNGHALGSGLLTIAGGEISSSGAGGFTLANTYSLAGNAAFGDSVNSGPLSFSGSGTLAAANLQIAVNSPVTLGGPIGGGFGWTLLGPSVMTLAGSNTFSGTTTVAGGTLQLNTSGAAALKGNLAVAGGAVQMLQSNQIASAASVSVAGGLLSIGANSNTVAGLQLTGGSIGGTTGSLTSNTAYDMQNGAVSVVLAGTAGMNITNGGTVLLSAANTFSGPTNIANGTLVLSHYLALQNSTAIVSSNGVLGFAAGTTAATLGGLSGGGNVDLDTAAAEPVALTVGRNGQTSAYSGNLSGAGGLVKVGSGMLTLGGTSSYSGATNVSTGTLQLVGLPSAPVAGYTTWFDASKLGLADGAAVTSLPDLSGNGNNAAAVTSGATGNPTYTANAVNGLGAVTLTGKEGLTFNRDSSIREVFSIFQGSSFLMTDTSVYNFHRSEASGATDNDPTASMWGHDASSFVNSSGTTYINGVAQNNAAITDTTGVTPTNLNNGFNLVEVLASGAVTANGFNDDRNFVHYAGNGGSGSQSQGEVIIYNSLLTDAQRQAVEAYLMYKWFGTISPGFAGSNILPVTTPLTVASGATVDLNGASQQVASLSGAGRITNSSAVAATFTVGDFTSTTFSGSINNAGGGPLALVKVGEGTLLLSGTNSFSGGTMVSEGTLVVTKTSGLADGSDLTVGDGSQFAAPIVPSPVAASPGAPASVPEPSALALLAAAIVGAGIWRRMEVARHSPVRGAAPPRILKA